MVLYGVAWVTLQRGKGVVMRLKTGLKLISAFKGLFLCGKTATEKAISKPMPGRNGCKIAAASPIYLGVYGIV